MAKPILLINIPHEVKHKEELARSFQKINNDIVKEYHSLFITSSVNKVEFSVLNADKEDALDFDELIKAFQEIVVKHNVKEIITKSEK